MATANRIAVSDPSANARMDEAFDFLPNGVSALNKPAPQIVPPKPTYQFNAAKLRANVPPELQSLNHWIPWRYALVNGKWTKPPLTLKHSGGGATNKPSDWSAIEDVVAAVDTDVFGDRYNGVGFTFSDTDFVGIEFDGVVADGQPEPFVLAILELLNNPWCEISPSGDGLHVVVQGKLPNGVIKNSANHYGPEAYDRTSSRYFTFTGEKFSGEGIPKIDEPTFVIVDFLLRQFKDEKFKRAWCGDSSDYANDDSRRDLGLLSMLSRKLNTKDRATLERYFTASVPGHRDKWNRTNAAGEYDYRDLTFNKVLADTAYGVQPADAPQSKRLREVQFQSAPRPESSVKGILRPLEQRAGGWCNVGRVSLFGGSSGVGKTTLTFDMLYKQKQGYPFLGHETSKLLFHVLTVDRPPKDYDDTIQGLGLLLLDFPRTQLPMVHDVEAAQAIADEIEKMDPTPSIIFVEGLDMLSSNQNDKVKVSPFMRQLQRVAEHFQIALIGSVGSSKTKHGQEYGHTRDKIAGSEAWGRLADTVLVMSFADDDDGTAPQRRLTVLPRNTAAEKFSLQFEGGRLVQVQATPESEKHGGGRPSEKIQAAIRFLTDKLLGEGVLGKTLIEQAFSQENISRSTLYDAAKILRVKKTPEGRDSRWTLEPIIAGSDSNPVTGEETDELLF